MSLEAAKVFAGLCGEIAAVIAAELEGDHGDED